MPVVTPDDVAAGFVELWGKNPPDLVSGGLHHERPTSGAEMPYAVVSIEEGETEEFSGTTYTQKFTARVSVWSNTPMPNTKGIRLAVEQTFRHAEKVEDKLRVPGADAVLYVKPVGGELKYDPQPKDAQNVVIAGGAWEVLIQADRASDHA